jgi:hypothetical protein
MRTLALIAVLTAVTPAVHAQRSVSSPARFAPGHNRGGHARSFLYPLAFSDPFYSDYLSSAGYSVAPQPPVVVTQPSNAAIAIPERFPSQPLMIELQGGRYVRISGGEKSGTDSDTELIDPVPESPRQQNSAHEAVRAGTVTQSVRTVLVFGDGHREEVSDYTIADGVLYAGSDYYTSGSWNRKIELSSLNLPETVNSNQSRGLRFQLPASPNEVIVGP